MSLVKYNNKRYQVVVIYIIYLLISIFDYTWSIVTIYINKLSRYKVILGTLKNGNCTIILNILNNSIILFMNYYKNSYVIYLNIFYINKLT